MVYAVAIECHRVIHVQLESEFCFIFFSFVPGSNPAAVDHTNPFVFTVYKGGPVLEEDT